MVPYDRLLLVKEIFMPEKRRMPTMHIIIVGCGKVGITLVEQLSREGHDITVLDINERVVRDVTELYDVMGITGSGVHMQVLREAGLETADIVISVTGSDEINLLCCTIAKKVGKRLVSIARVRNPEYIEELPYLRQQLGIAMIINPDLEAAREIGRIISRPQARSVSAFAKGHAELVRFTIPEGNVLDGKQILTLDRLFSFGYILCAIERDGEVSIPKGTDSLKAGDDITILAASRDVNKIFTAIGMRTGSLRSCMIIGGGKTSYYLARQLLDQRMDVRIIESDPKRCDELDALLPEATIINGNGSDEQVLKEEGIDSVEAFVALTGIDEENILMTLYANRIQGLKTITKINRITFNDVIDDLDLGSVVYPKYICAEEITAYVRARRNSIGSNVETLYHMFDNRVEAIEFHIEKGSPVIGIPLMRLKKKDQLLIACINRNGKILFPRGQDTIEAGDGMIVITKHTGFGDASDILL